MDTEAVKRLTANSARHACLRRRPGTREVSMRSHFLFGCIAVIFTCILFAAEGQADPAGTRISEQPFAV